jgi:hypothetical protein
MLTHVRVAILRDISQSIAFADDRHGEVEQLIIEGYVMKAGDLYELTSKGLRAVEDHPTNPARADQKRFGSRRFSSWCAHQIDGFSSGVFLGS